MTLPHSFDADDSPERPKVLLVDDDDLALMLTAEALRGRGFEITEASSGEQALAMLTEWTPRHHRAGRGDARARRLRDLP